MNLWSARFHVTYKSANCPSYFLSVSVSTSWAHPAFIVSPCELCVNICMKQRVLRAGSGCLPSLLRKMGSKLGGRKDRIILFVICFPSDGVRALWTLYSKVQIYEGVWKRWRMLLHYLKLPYSNHSVPPPPWSQDCIYPGKAVCVLQYLLTSACSLCMFSLGKTRIPQVTYDRSLTHKISFHLLSFPHGFLVQEQRSGISYYLGVHLTLRTQR